MAFNLFKSSKTQVGVDIGTSAIKIVELSREGGRWKLLNYGIYQLHAPGGQADTSRTIMNLSDEEISQAIASTIKSAGIRSRDAIASIASFSTFATVIEMPYVGEEDLAKTVPFEARKYVPVPLDQVVLDWAIVGTVDGQPLTPSSAGPQQATPTVEVFLAAVPKDETSRYQRIMRTAGLNLIALELENSSLIRALLGNDLSGTAVLSLGGRSTSIVIVNKGYERLSHNYEIGGYEITKAVATAQQIDYERAEGLKHTQGLLEGPQNAVRSAIIPMVDMMIFETKKTIESYEQSKGAKVGRVVLVGGVANMPGMASYVKQRMDREILIGNVFARLIYPQELTPLTESLSNTLAVAVGCAMRP